MSEECRFSSKNLSIRLIKFENFTKVIIIFIYVIFSNKHSYMN